jgi:hypothetical protein
LSRGRSAITDAAASSTSPSATTQTAQDFQNAQLAVSDHQLEGHGFRVWGVAISPDGRRAMTWVQHGMGAGPAGFATP